MLRVTNLPNANIDLVGSLCKYIHKEEANMTVL